MLANTTLRLCISTLVLFSFSTAAFAAAKDPAEVAYKDKFSKDEREVRLTKATTDDAQFAQRLLTEIDSGKHDPALTLLLCEKAYYYGLRDKQGYPAANQAIDKLVEKDNTRAFDAGDMRVALFEKWLEAEPNRDKGQYEAFIDHSLKLCHESTETEDSGQALKLLNRVNRFASRIDSPRKNDVRDSITDLVRTRQTLEEITKLQELLGTDPAAADKLALVYLAHLDNPEKAKGYAKQMSDAALVAKVLLAASDFADVPPEAASEAGLFYYSLVTENKTRDPIAMLIRSRVWLTEFLSRDQPDAKEADQVQAIQTARETLGEIDSELLKRGIGKKLRRKMSSLLRGDGQFDRPPEIQAAIDKGVQWLYTQHNGDRHWDTDAQGHRNWGGYTALVAYALLMADEEPQLNGKLSRAVHFMMTTNMTGTYALCFRIHAWEVLPRRERYRQTLMQDVARLRKGATRHGFWGYTMTGKDVVPGSRLDLSTTLAGGLGMWIGESVGGLAPKKIYWERTARALVEHQLDDDGWSYNPATQETSTGSMTAAALTLLHASYPHLGDVTRKRADQAIERGMKWMDANFSATANVNRAGHKCYYFAAVQHVGLFSGQKDFRELDWYDAIAAHLVKSQGPNGTWGSVQETAFAVAFLCRGGIVYEPESEIADADEAKQPGAENAPENPAPAE